MPIYLDYNASTPIAPEVREAMAPYLESHFGNPSAGHWAGRPAREAVDKARGHVAALLACQPHEVIFTSGGTEANNHALKGVFYRRLFEGQPTHVITTSVEHPSILETCAFLERAGAEVTRVDVDGAGRVDPDDVASAFRPNTALLTVMHANNEVGTIQPLAELSRLAREQGALFHTDAAQSTGKIPVEVDRLGVDLLSIAAQKCYGPKGAGALYVRDGVELETFMHGGGHESGRRSGTENVPLIVAMGRAAELASRAHDADGIRALRDELMLALQDGFGDGVVLNGHPTERLPNTLNVSFVGKDAGVLVAGLEGLAVSTGSACHSGTGEMSPVLKAMGAAPGVGFGAVRLSLGRPTTREEILEAAAILVEAAKRTPAAPETG